MKAPQRNLSSLRSPLSSLPVHIPDLPSNNLWRKVCYRILADSFSVIATSVVQKVVCLGEERLFVTRIDQHTARVVHNLGNAAHARGQHGQSAGKGLDNDTGQVLEVGEEQQKVAVAVHLGHLCGTLPAVEDNRVDQTVLLHEIAKCLWCFVVVYYVQYEIVALLVQPLHHSQDARKVLGIVAQGGDVQDLFALLMVGLFQGETVGVGHIVDDTIAPLHAATLHVAGQVLADGHDGIGVAGNALQQSQPACRQLVAVLRLVARPVLRDDVGRAVALFPVVRHQTGRVGDVHMDEVGHKAMLPHIRQSALIAVPDAPFAHESVMAVAHNDLHMFVMDILAAVDARRRARNNRHHHRAAIFWQRIDMAEAEVAQRGIVGCGRPTQQVQDVHRVHRLEMQRYKKDRSSKFRIQKTKNKFHNSIISLSLSQNTFNMKRFLFFMFLLSVAELVIAQPLEKNHPVNFAQVSVNDNFWAPRIQRHAEVTIPFCLDQCMVQTNRVNNFAIAAGLKKGIFKGVFFDDSDLYKVLEGVSYSLRHFPNPEVEHVADSIISLIAAAQQPDGYINTYYTINGLDKRWTDMDKHEMYCGGHLIEAALAYYDATGKDALLKVATRWADYLCETFGPGKKDWVPGHEEIELALVKLYRHTQEKKYLDLAHFLLEERGRGIVSRPGNPGYDQNAVPVKDLKRIGGHAVRAMYLFTGMADYASAASDPTYLPALHSIWEHLTTAQMYVTGGIGSSKHNEGFTEDFDKPNREAYCETCASVGMVFWNQRMNMFSGDGKYIDVLERSLYNGALAGMSVSGDRFFYVNPLSSDGGHHRKPWYGTACCPSQLSRFIASVGGYIYALSDDAVWVNLYVGSSTKVAVPKANTEVTIAMETDYPWDGKVSMVVMPEKPARFAVKLRIPSWCESWSVYVDGKLVKAKVHDGYLTIDRKWTKESGIVLNMEMPVTVLTDDPRVKANEGRKAIQRGPLVYCIEQTDNPDMDHACILKGDEYKVLSDNALLPGTKVIQAQKSGLRFIPYFLWDNREAGRMDVWVPAE